MEETFEGLALSNDCIQAFTTVTGMPVGDPSVTSPSVAGLKFQ